MKTETPKIFRIITQTEGVTMTAETAKAVTQQEASRIAEKDLIPPNVKLQNYVLQPICTERQWKYGQINFCPRCGKNICEDPEIGGDNDRWVYNSQEFECPECYAEISVEIKSTREERDDDEECETCIGEGGITPDHFGDTTSFECPDCKGTGRK